MLEEAVHAKDAIEALDLDGVMRLLRHVNELRDAATANLEERAMRGRKGNGKGKVGAKEKGSMRLRTRGREREREKTREKLRERERA
jgi:hypothetical protein